jgi:uncharacterized protein
MSLKELSSVSVELLLGPEVYPHPVGELQLLETHISWVLLTGEIAYKIKKPCKFSFVDYSTLELRHEFCLRELEYNRRLAAEIYLDVVPIFVTEDGALRIGESIDGGNVSGVPIEYAVKMKQFPQEAILTSRIEHHELTPESIEKFGGDVASFHDSVESVNPKLECVQLTHIRQDAIDNIILLKEALPKRSSLQPLLETLKTWTEDEFARRESVFQKRLDNGYVRRCHGDMHLNNLVQIDSKVMAFDCIEFNEEFQWIDVLSDLAFPMMDFLAKERPDLAWRLLNAYLEAREDWYGLEVFRFYAVYRAMVRAKVTWLDQSKHIPKSKDIGMPEETGPWEQYIHTAMRLAFPEPCRLAITYGLSGSGKSSQALSYVTKHGGLRVRSDIERRRMAKELESEVSYSMASRERVYKRLYIFAKLLLGWNYSTAVDATFLKLEMRQKFQALASSIQVPMDIIACEVSVEELERRILLRSGDPSEATLDVLHRQFAEIDELTEAERLLVYRDSSR